LSQLGSNAVQPLYRALIKKPYQHDIAFSFMRAVASYPVEAIRIGITPM
jgi:hypothetical protein